MGSLNQRLRSPDSFLPWHPILPYLPKFLSLILALLELYQIHASSISIQLPKTPVLHHSSQHPAELRPPFSPQFTVILYFSFLPISSSFCFHPEGFYRSHFSDTSRPVQLPCHKALYQCHHTLSYSHSDSVPLENSHAP